MMVCFFFFICHFIYFAEDNDSGLGQSPRDSVSSAESSDSGPKSFLEQLNAVKLIPVKHVSTSGNSANVCYSHKIKVRLHLSDVFCFANVFLLKPAEKFALAANQTFLKHDKNRVSKVK